MRARRMLPVLGLLAAVLGAPAHAATVGSLVLRGTGTVGADLVLRSPGTVDLSAFTPDPRTDVSGLVVRDARGHQLALVVQVHRWAQVPSAPPPLTTRPGVLRLAAGRYRLELLATGPATVRVRATGSLVRTVLATASTHDRVALTDLGAGGVPVVEQRYSGVVLAPGRAVVLAFFERSTAHQASVPQLCFPEPAARTCVGAVGFTAAVESVGGVGDGWVQSFTAAYGGEGLDGPHDALVQDVTVDVPKVLDALLVTV